MAKRERREPSKPNQSYLISFGDTMTALLAFFIVLNALAEEQTGIDLHSGTGSFVEITSNLGVKGIFTDGMSRYATQLKESTPLYNVTSDDNDDATGSGTGPDEDGDTSWVRDREQEEYERFLIELERLHQVKPQPMVDGEVSFDRFERLPAEPPLFDAAMREMMIPLAPQLRSGNYEVELVIWSPTPAPTAWKRSLFQAYQLREEVIKAMRLTPDEARRFSAVAKTWIYSDVKRPILTLTLRKVGRLGNQ